jgi:hypothetical protein
MFILVTCALVVLCVDEYSLSYLLRPHVGVSTKLLPTHYVSLWKLHLKHRLRLKLEWTAL